MRQFLLLVLLVSTIQVFAQKPAKADKYGKTITASELKEHLYIVASEEMGGRETGTEGERKAAAYI